MPSWKKLVTSGSSPTFNHVTASGNISGSATSTGSFGMGNFADKIGIGTTSPTYALDVAGNAGFDEYIYHNDDADTYLRFQNDDINIQAGAVDFIKITEDSSFGGQDEITFNDGGEDIDFIVESPNESKAMYLNSGNEVLHVNHGESNFQTKIHNTNGLGITVNSTGVVLNDDGVAGNDFRVESDRVEYALFVDSGNNSVGIGTSAPKTPLTVFDEDNIISNLSTGTGGGEIVTFGTLTFSPAVGNLLYLSTAGKWFLAESGHVTSGSAQLLGLAMGTSVADGIMLRGFMNVSSTYLLNFDDGEAVYVDSTAGKMDTTAPTSGFVRNVGYCTVSSQVMYFNPGPAWVEIA